MNKKVKGVLWGAIPFAVIFIFMMMDIGFWPTFVLFAVVSAMGFCAWKSILTFTKED